MAVVEKTIDIIGDEQFSALIMAKDIPEGMPTDFYDIAIKTLRKFALRYMNGLETVNFPNVETTGGYAFAGCPALKKATMESLKTVGSYDFSNCVALKEVDFPLVTSIGEHAFNGTGLERIEFPLVTSVQYSPYLFYNCKSLVEVVLPRLTRAGNMMFASCTSLKQLDLPSLELIQGQLISGCTALEVINIGPNIATIPTNGFSGAPDGLVINLGVAEGTISGAPWGAANAVINYEVPYSGDVPMPT